MKISITDIQFNCTLEFIESDPFMCPRPYFENEEENDKGHAPITCRIETFLLFYPIILLDRNLFILDKIIYHNYYVHNVFGLNG